MLWACVFLPSLALDGAQRLRPPVVEPFALVHGSTQQRRLFAVNGLARARGLYPGQRLIEAQALCGRLLTEAHNPNRLESDLALIAAWAYRYSSQVVLDPPRAVALEIGRSLGLFGPWSRLQARLRSELAELGFAHRIALAPNPCVARVLARARDGAAVTTQEAMISALAPIPVTRANLPVAAAQALPGMGIRTLGELMDVPRVALRRRFGKDFIGALQALLGEHPSELPSYRPPPRFDARIELPAEITNQAALRFPLRRLIGDLAAFAATRDGGIERFVVRFEHDEAAPTEVAIGLLAPEREVEALFEVTKLKLERTTLAAPVTAVGVRAGAPSPFVPAGRDLFDSRPAETLPWEKLRERLRACLGEAAVYEFAADPDPRPEFASRCRGRETSVEQARELPLSRPAWLLSRPMPLFASPARILVGPERIETGWWDGGDIRRDYYVVELASGQRAWAFAAPGEREHFMLHGWFA